LVAQRTRQKHREYKHLVLESTNQGVVGSSPAGRAKNQRVGSENQVLLPPVGPLWDLLSTGPRDIVTIQALGVKNQVLLLLPWDSVGLFIHTSVPIDAASHRKQTKAS
jgi:hypothetical protein